MFHRVVEAVPLWKRERVGVGIVGHKSDIRVAYSVVTWPDIWTNLRADELRMLLI
jgi:hypothetical protein